MPETSATGRDRPAPLVLAFDTAGSACSVALGRGGAVLAYERREMRHGHAEALLPMIDRVVAGLSPAKIDTVAITTGPGGFTGIRAGLAAGQGLALAINARLVGITSFAAVAALLALDSTPILVVLDSRREDLYAQLFAGDGSPLCEPAAVPPRLLGEFAAAAIADGALLIAGDAADKAAAAVSERADVTVIAGSAPDARGVLVAACRSNFTGEVRPLYLRPPDVSFPKAQSGIGSRT